MTLVNVVGLVISWYILGHILVAHVYEWRCNTVGQCCSGSTWVILDSIVIVHHWANVFRDVLGDC